MRSGSAYFAFGKVGFAWQPAIVLLLSFTSFRLGRLLHRTVQRDGAKKFPKTFSFFLRPYAIFIFGFFVKTAPWGWDNLKLMMWGYFLVLPFLWNELIKNQTLAVKAVALIALFGSGFVSLFGGLAAGRPGYGFADRAEVDGVGNAVSKFAGGGTIRCLSHLQSSAFAGRTQSCARLSRPSLD